LHNLANELAKKDHKVCPTVDGRYFCRQHDPSLVASRRKETPPTRGAADGHR
jgi:hypothetical protein